jgi:CubicO group peptidase (beta-lactamase class C family)
MIHRGLLRFGLRRVALMFLLALASPNLTSAEQLPSPVARVMVRFNTKGITGTLAEGQADRTSGRPVTADDPVRIASISKMVVAIAVMRLVEQRRLSLDTDVSSYLGWRLRHPNFPETPITLRLLLSHRSSITDEADYQIPLDASLRAKFDEPKVWDIAHRPGSYFRYTNLNFPVVAAVMEKVTGERFDLLMDRLVLRPLGIQACYNWANCPPEVAARAVVLYDAKGTPLRDDHHGRPPACGIALLADGSCDLSRWQAGSSGGAFSPQGGLRISANGLARIGRLLLGRGQLDGVRLLSRQSVKTMVTPVWTFDGSNGQTAEGEAVPGKAFFCRYGLAVQTLATRRADCGDDPFGDGVQRFGHAGEAYSLLSGLWIDPAAGTGVAFYVTGADMNQPGRRSAFFRVEEDLLDQQIP